MIDPRKVSDAVRQGSLEKGEAMGHAFCPTCAFKPREGMIKEN